MRDKIAAAVADVREEHDQGRLSWSVADVKHLIQPHPRHAKDTTLARLGDDNAAVAAGEKPYADSDSDGTDDDAGALIERSDCDLNPIRNCGTRWRP